MAQRAQKLSSFHLLRKTKGEVTYHSRVTGHAWAWCGKSPCLPGVIETQSEQSTLPLSVLRGIASGNSPCSIYRNLRQDFRQTFKRIKRLFVIILTNLLTSSQYYFCLLSKHVLLLKWQIAWFSLHIYWIHSINVLQFIGRCLWINCMENVKNNG